MSDNHYIATDYDLPPNMWPGFVESQNRPTIDEQKRREAAVALHYPEIRVKQEARRAERIMRAHRRSERDDGRKIYLKLAKKCQMFDWVNGLQVSFPIMRLKERQFCEHLLTKFMKYSPVKAKWITQAQYNWLKWIASQYLMVPK